MVDENLRDRRQRAGLSQQELAELAGCSISMLQMLERGYMPRTESATRRRIEEALAFAEGKTAA